MGERNNKRDSPLAELRGATRFAPEQTESRPWGRAAFRLIKTSFRRSGAMMNATRPLGHADNTEDGIKKYVKRVPEEYRQFVDYQNTDEEYAKFFCKCLYLQDKIKSKYTKAPELITPRRIDYMLLR